MGAASQMHGYWVTCGGQVSGQQGLVSCPRQQQPGNVPDTAKTQVQVAEGPGSASKPCLWPPSAWLLAQRLTFMASAKFIEVVMPGNSALKTLTGSAEKTSKRARKK